MAASVDALGALHALVAASLKEDLEAAEQIEDPGLRALARDKARAQAITFLKNNSITADPETNAGLSELRAKLQRKRDVGKESLAQAAEAFAERVGPMQ